MFLEVFATDIEKVYSLPDKSGVYIMKDASGNVLYVGKAVSLRNRVRSYFQSPAGLSPKTRALVEKVDDVEYMVTDSEIEALILENNLIKRYEPRYNVRLKDDKTYPYVKVTVGEAFPKITVTRRVEDDGARYFGPYADTGALYETLRFLKRLFRVRSCKKELGNGPKSARPCLNYYIKRCLGPCAGLVDEGSYREAVNDVLLFLEGRQDQVITQLRRAMEDAADREEFEEAARLRDLSFDVEKVVERQKIVSTSRDDQDILAVARDGELVSCQVFFVRGGKLVGREHFLLENAGDSSDPEALEAFVKQYYSRASFVPREILLQHQVEGKDSIGEWLSRRRGSKVTMVVPRRGEKKALVDMVYENAKLSLAEARARIARKEAFEEEAVFALQEILGLDTPPRRIEAFDISNVAGREAVGSMVVFMDGRPLRSGYKRFKIRGIEGSNDFAMMAQVVGRRYRRGAGGGKGFEDLPDLILIDGGPGQLGAAQEALADAGLADIPMIGLAKEFERIYSPGRTEPLELPRDSKALFLLQRVRDEAHRFAVSYHRELHGKSALLSQLEELPGIGKRRVKALLARFGSLEGLRGVSEEEIAAVPGMNRRAAKVVYDFMKGQGGPPQEADPQMQPPGDEVSR